jgi:hypothetical protein
MHEHGLTLTARECCRILTNLQENRNKYEALFIKGIKQNEKFGKLVEYCEQKLGKNTN